MITEERLQEIEQAPREAYITKAEAMLLADAYRVTPILHKRISALGDAANALLDQIDRGDFTDSLGHDARMLKAVHDLMRLMARSFNCVDTLRRDPDHIVDANKMVCGIGERS